MRKSHQFLAVFFGVIVISAGIAASSKAAPSISDIPNKQQRKVKADIEIPICLDRSDIPQDELHWLAIPISADQLATYEYYGFLSGQLIINGTIDASDCPQGGLWDNGYANTCGMEKSRDAVFYLQNVYDDEILAQVDDVGVPPVLIKQLIRFESQFWPGYMGQYHFGLGHVTEIGSYNALQWNPELYDDMCISTYQQSCGATYFRANYKDVLAGRLLGVMDASCSSCDYGIDIPKAEQSIDYIAKALMGYCRQTSQIVENATRKTPNDVIDYATIWKMTLVSYNMGPSCVYNAVTSGYNAIKNDPDRKMDWALLSSYLLDSDCLQGKLYTDKITRKFYDFSSP